ncbi:MAG: CbiQ family ECF transporter T component [Gallionella sp.]
MRLHPATQILTWGMLVAVMQFIKPDRVLIAGVLMLLLAFMLSHHKFLQLLRRTRWIMFSLLLIYAYTTPGAAISTGLGMLSPSREGLQAGGLQLLRLLVALAGLAILLDRLHRQKLMAGLYALFAPLQWLGFSRERLAVRLALTLHYAEVAMLRTQSWKDHLRSLTAQDEEDGRGERTMVLPIYRFARADVMLLAGLVFLGWLVMQ